MNLKTYHEIKLREIRRGNLAILDHLVLDDGITIEKIERTVCHFTSVPRDVVYNPIRNREIVQARQLIHSFIKKNFRMSLKNIGKITGGKDHATVLHSVKTVNNLVDTDKTFRKLYEDIEKELV